MNIRYILAFILALFSCKGEAQESTTIYPTADMWLGNTYATTAQNNNYIRIGGWGDRYFGFWRFNWSDVNKDKEIESVILHLPPDELQNSYNKLVTSATFYAITSSWNEKTTRISDGFRGWNLGSFAINANNGLILDITDLYEWWQENPNDNQGFMLFPNQTDNKWFFFPSRESKATDRPRAVVTYKETIPNFKLPLPGGKEWLLNTKIGTAKYPSHTGINHYSVDFDPTSRSMNTATDEKNVRVYAAADGIVCDVGYKPRTGADPTNGYYVVIDHDGDNNVKTGFQTRYLHLAFDPTLPGPVFPGLKKGRVVKQGQFVGTLGKTGTDEEHLHFGIRYKDDGSNSGEAAAMIRKVRVDGYLMSDFVVGRYYKSTNTK